MHSTPSDVFRSQYQALVSSRRDSSPTKRRRKSPDAFADLERRLANYKPVRKQACSVGCSRQGRAAARPLRSWRGRPRQDHADDLFFQTCRWRTSAARISMIHGRGA